MSINHDLRIRSLSREEGHLTQRADESYSQASNRKVSEEIVDVQNSGQKNGGNLKVAKTAGDTNTPSSA